MSQTYRCLVVVWVASWLGAPVVADETGASAAKAGAVPLPAFAADDLLRHVKVLAGKELQGRQAGTPFEQRTIDYLSRQLETCKVSTLPKGIRVQTFPVSVSGVIRTSGNVLGVIYPSKSADVVNDEGPPKLRDVLVLGAHLDHLGQTVAGQLYPGADDNASGLSVILEVAKRLQQNTKDWKRPVVIAFFGAEEMGLIGSRRFVSEGPIEKSAMLAMVNIDMIGRPLMDQKKLATAKRFLGFDSRAGLGVIGLDNRPLFRQAVEDACAAAKVAPYGSQAVLAPILRGLSRNRSDHSPFEDAGIPTIFFSSGESDDYHRPSDTWNTVDAKLMAQRAEVVYRVMQTLATAPRDRFQFARPAETPE